MFSFQLGVLSPPLFTLHICFYPTEHQKPSPCMLSSESKHSSFSKVMDTCHKSDSPKTLRFNVKNEEFLIHHLLPWKPGNLTGCLWKTPSKQTATAPLEVSLRTGVETKPSKPAFVGLKGFKVGMIFLDVKISFNSHFPKRWMINIFCSSFTKHDRWLSYIKGPKTRGKFHLVDFSEGCFAQEKTMLPHLNQLQIHGSHVLPPNFPPDFHPPVTWTVHPHDDRGNPIHDDPNKVGPEPIVIFWSFNTYFHGRE